MVTISGRNCPGLRNSPWVTTMIFFNPFSYFHTGNAPFFLPEQLNIELFNHSLIVLTSFSYEVDPIHWTEFSVDK
jgi:hypothetical protein